MQENNGEKYQTPCIFPDGKIYKIIVWMTRNSQFHFSQETKTTRNSQVYRLLTEVIKKEKTTSPCLTYWYTLTNYFASEILGRFTGTTHSFSVSSHRPTLGRIRIEEDLYPNENYLKYYEFSSVYS